MVSKYALKRARGVLVNFVGMLGWGALGVMLLSVAATWLCLRLGLVAELPTFLIGTAIVFPIGFSLSAAYRRREEALSYFANLKGDAVSLFYAHRDWVPGDDLSHALRMRELVEQLLRALAGHFSVAGHREWDERRLYRLFSQISLSIESMRDAGVPANEIARANQYLRTMINQFERMRNIYIYRTPLSLRAYSLVFLYSFPILFAPYFAFLSVDSGIVATGYFMAVLYSLVLVTLENVQAALENPFDEIGIDDLDLNVVDLYHMILVDEPEPFRVPDAMPAPGSASD